MLNKKSWEMQNESAFNFGDEAQENESIYSLTVRYHIMAGNWSTYITLGELFGRANGRVPYQPMPAKLGEFVKRIPKKDRLSDFETLVLNHTSFPYHSCFIPPDRRILALEVLKKTGTAAAGLSMGLINAPGGRAAADMAYCPECEADDRSRLGYAYWRVSHQLPLVTVCHTHGSPLVTGCLHCGLTLPTHFVFAQPGRGCACGQFMPTYRETMLDAADQFWIAKESHAAWLLGRRAPFEELIGDFRPYFLNSGFRAPGGVDKNRFMESLQNLVGQPLIKALDCEEENERGPKWLRYMLSKKKSTRNTLRTVLLCRYFFGGVNQIAPPSQEQAHPRDEWKRNLKELYERLPGTDAVAKEVGRGYATVKAEALRQGIQVITNASSKYEEIPRQLVIEMLSEGKTSAEVCSALGINIYWVSRILQECPELQVKRKMDEKNRLVIKHRACIENALKTHPLASRDEINRKVPSACGWLRKNDRKWLEARFPPSRAKADFGGKRGKRNDWEAIDAAAAPKVVSAAADARSVGNSPHISETFLLRKLKLFSRYKAHVNDMPLTRARLNEHVESKTEFHQRRLAWAVEQLSTERIVVAWYQVVRKAGIDDSSVDAQRDFVMDLVKKHGLQMKELTMRRLS